MNKALYTLGLASILSFILGPSMKAVPITQNHFPESATMLLLGLTLIGVARILRAKTII